MQVKSSITNCAACSFLAMLLFFSNNIVAQSDSATDRDCASNKNNREQVYHVALLIPLYLEQVADTLWEDNLDPAKIAEMQPFRFIQFYHGFMLAADSLKQKGLNLEVSVYDVDNVSSKLNSVLLKPEMKDMDLIVGPFFKNSFTLAAAFASEHRIPIINPLSSRPDILDNNHYVFKLLPSIESQPAIVSELVRREFPDHNIILYTANKMQNAEQIAKLKEAVELGDATGKQKVTVADYASDSIQGFRNFASLSKPNLVIIYADNEVLPAALLSKLAAMKDDYRISVIGLPEWEKFTNIESLYLIALNTHIFSASYLDATSDNVKGFIRSYRAKYFDEPLYYAQTGFDAGYYFLSALMNYGKDFERCLDQNKVTLTQNQYHFEQKSGGGYDNVNWNVLQYMEYFFIKKSFY